jgi:7,8-dihydropterin-6-yl-methyl-4-(beta-D-ribofuranosyl)aminobenzene 5'-phosphate synthase
MVMLTLRCLVDDKSCDSTRFRAEHGVSFAIETPTGKILFDTGASGKMLVQNAAQLDFDLHQVDVLVLSHAHDDHTGGLAAFLQNSQSGLPLYAHPDIFRPRYAGKEGKVKSVGLRMAQADLVQRATLHLSADPSQVLPGVWTTGEITPRTEFEGRSPRHYIQADGGWQPDPYRDDMALVLEAKAGLIVICGCCHAGLLNTLAQVRRVFKKDIAAIVGGTHLGSVDEDKLEHAIAMLHLTSAGKLPDLYLNHCTGERALGALAKAFGEKINPCPAGTVLRFE